MSRSAGGGSGGGDGDSTSEVGDGRTVVLTRNGDIPSPSSQPSEEVLTSSETTAGSSPIPRTSSKVISLSSRKSETSQNADLPRP